MISEASSDDAGAASALLLAADPHNVSSTAGVRFWIETSPPAARARWWKASTESGLVGWASASLDTMTAEPGRAFASVVVHPDRRRRGHGSALWQAVAAHLDEIGATRTSISTHADDAATGFARARGLRLTSTETVLSVDPRTIEPEPPPEGVEIRSLSAFADDPEPIYRCDVEAAQDEPGPFGVDALTLESWRRMLWDQPDLDRDLGVAAIAAGEAVGASFLLADRPSGRAMNVGTGVVRSHRGLGLGLLMKRHVLARAAAAGITRVVTHNDETNTPMLAINRRLGYQPLAVSHWWVWET